VRSALHSVDGPPSGSILAGVVMVGGGDGGLDGPAESLYPTLGNDLAGVGIATLRVDFRVHQFPGDVEEGVADVLTGVRYLIEQGVERLGVLGHSFGGAVVIESAAEEPAIRSVVTLATQTAGAQRVAELAPVPLLLVHGLDDVRLTPDCSRMLYRLAGEPKRLELLDGATHSLRQRREDVRELVRRWFVETLG
jgi:alpha/beta superfamily hydrolase